MPETSNRKDVRETIEVIARGRPFEIRTLNPSLSGLFDDIQSALDAVDWVIEKKRPDGIFIGLNEIDCSQENLDGVVPKITNQLSSGRSVSAQQIGRRRFLLVDIDPVRKSGTRATDAQHEASWNKAKKIEAWLSDHGFPRPALKGDSGNGAHLLYAIDLPVDSDLVSRVLRALHEQFNDPDEEIPVTVDLANSDPARVVRLYGTPNRKGVDKHDPRPTPTFVLEKGAGQAVSEVCLEVVATDAEEDNTVRWSAGYSSGEGIDLEATLTASEIDFRIRKTPDGKRFLVIGECPLCLAGNLDPHDRNPNWSDVVFFEHKDGGVGFRCQHNRCIEYSQSHPGNIHSSSRPVGHAQWIALKEWLNLRYKEVDATRLFADYMETGEPSVETREELSFEEFAAIDPVKLFDKYIDWPISHFVRSNEGLFFPGGLVDEVIEFILGAMNHEQIEYAAAVAYSVLAAACRGRITTGVDAAPGGFFLLLGGASTGKSHAPKIGRTLLEKAIGSHLVIDAITGASAISRHSIDNPYNLLVLDEFHLMLAKAKDPRSIEFNIMQALLRCYNAAPYRAVFANARDNIEIADSRLDVIACAISEPYFKALDKNIAQGGFISRLLVFEATPNAAYYPDRVLEQLPVDGKLLDEIRWLYDVYAAEPKHLSLSNDARELYIRTEKEEYQKRIRKRTEQGDDLAMGDRAGQKAIRLACVSAVSHRSDTISVSDMQWAFDLVRYLELRHEGKLAHIGQSEPQAIGIKILRVLSAAKKGTLCGSDLCRKVQSEHRHRALRELIDCEYVLQWYESSKGSRGRQKHLYRITAGGRKVLAELGVASQKA
ncbi:MAG: DUF3987 domain-containing protein [Planctomycetales bacterium]|nr:DUF3987 domain-containing protein [Planctomycetales bacterium]